MANIMRLGGGSGGGKAKKLLSSLTEGSLVSVLEDGKLVPFYVAKHDYEADLNGEGRTLLVRKNVHSSMNWNGTAVNAYATSSVDSWLNNDYVSLLSATVKAQTVATEIPYTAGNGTTSVSALRRNIFILSATEYGFNSSGCNVEGSKLPIAEMIQSAGVDGTMQNQWTRSPRTTNKTESWFVNGGTSIYYATTNNPAYIRPCFTLPATMALLDESYADGSWGLADENVLFDIETASTMAKSGVSYTNGIADLDAGTLNDIAAAISANPNIDKYMGTIYYDKGNVHRKISVGDTQNITVDGVSYPVSILGFNHDDLAFCREYGDTTATGKAGITFQLKNCLTTGYVMNPSNTNAGGWGGCAMRGSMATILGQFPSGLKSVLKTAKKLSSVGGNSSAINTTEDKLFLLAEIEIFGSLTHSFAGEGSQYAYYKAGNSKIKSFQSGSATSWWERSPAKDTISFCLVSNTGAAAGVNSGAAAPIGCSFAYCI